MSLIECNETLTAEIRQLQTELTTLRARLQLVEEELVKTARRLEVLEKQMLPDRSWLHGR